MRIFFFSDKTEQGHRVRVETPCNSCQSLGAILISNGSQGAIAHFDSEQELQQIVAALLRKLEAGKEGRLMCRISPPST